MNQILLGNRVAMRLGYTAIALLWLASIGNAYAQTATQPERSAKQMEEITVTARKREETLQQAPVAISVIAADQIRDTGIANMNDVGARLPNVSSIEQPAGLDGNGFAPNIRGMRSASRQIGEESGLGIFIDGAYAGSNAAGNKFLPPVDRVEFLPGPQATLFGKNTTLGVINIVTKKPGEELESEARASVGNDGHQELTATVMGPVSDSVSLGLTVGTRRYSGFEVNHNAVEIPNDAEVPASQFIGADDGVKGPDLDAWGGALQLAYRGENNRLDVMVDHVNNERTKRMPFGRIEGFDALPRDTYNTSSLGRQIVEETGVTATYNHDLGAGDLTSISNYREFFTDDWSDDDLYPFRVVDIDIWVTEQEQFSQEFRWAQEIGALSYLAGVYYQDQKLNMDRGAQLLIDTPFESPILIEGEMRNKTIAAFTNGDIELGEAWGLELGLRYGKEDKDMPYFRQSGADQTLGLWAGSITDSRSTNNTSYTAAVTFAATDTLNTHLRYSRGYKSGGFTMDFVTTFDPPQFYEFDDEQADSYELGAKWQATDTLWLNAVLFYTDYTDLQVSQLLTIPGSSTPFFVTGNAGKAVTKGIETTLTYSGDNLTLNASVGYNDAYYTEWLRPEGDTLVDEAGRNMPSPRWTGNLFGSYDIGNLTLIGEYLYRDGRPAVPGEGLNRFTDDMDQINLRARYNFSDNWSASLWVTNLTDERAVIDRTVNIQTGFLADFAGFTYPSSFVNVPDMIVGGYQPPRQYGLDVEFRF